MKTPEWLTTISLSSAGAPTAEQGWCSPACRDHYIEQTARADVPLMHAMLLLLAEELGATACELARIRYLLVGEDQDEVGRRWAAVEAALAHYHDGTLPEKEKPDGEGTRTG